MNPFLCFLFLGTCWNRRRADEFNRRIGMRRGDERIQDRMYSYVSLKQRVPADHPLRGVRKVTDAVLRSFNAQLDA
jgi:hypothetical protein